MSFWKTLLATILGFFVGMLLLGVFSFLMMIAVIASSSERAQVAVMRNSVLKIEPDGAIAEYFRVAGLKGFGTDNEALTLREYLSRIEAAKKDDRIEGILLKLGSYRGSWAQAQEFRRALEDFKTSGKFIYASSSSQGYNEINYFLATVADSILFNPAASMEINGIAASVTYFKPMLERIGVQAQVVRAGSFKSAVEPFILDSASAESEEMMMQLVEGSFAPFRQAVQEKRKITSEQLDDILTNRALVTAAEARDLRLVDAVIYDDEIAKLISTRTSVTGKPRLVDISDYYSQKEDMDEDAPNNQIAVVYATGTINRGESDYSPGPFFGGESIGDETFAEAMRTARENSSIKAVVLRIDSPGGDAAASEEMWREVVLTREKKPVIVSMGAVAASGGYFIAAPADTIIAEPTTLTGSIGVFGLRGSIR
jgi:protease-4